MRGGEGEGEGEGERYWSSAFEIILQPKTSESNGQAELAFCLIAFSILILINIASNLKF